MFTKIMYPTDFSEVSRKAIPYLNHYYGANLLFLIRCLHQTTQRKSKRLSQMHHNFIYEQNQTLINGISMKKTEHFHRVLL
ncbi:MAG: hypothetical protein ACLFPI_03670 [Desulfobacterales bacterium]